MQVSTWMLRLKVRPTGEFYLEMLYDVYGLFCNRHYKQFIFVIIERCMDFINGALK